MATALDLENVVLVRDQALALLVSETAAPTGNSGYYIDYLLGLTKVIQWCEDQRTANMPYHVASQAFTAGGR